MDMKTLKETRLAEMATMLQTDPTALNYDLRSEATSQLKTMIAEIATMADLDEEKVARRVTVAVKSPYGRIPGLMNLLTSLVLWPVEGNDFSGVAELKEEILKKYSLDEELLIDIKDAKGYHTFLNDDHDIIKGQSPDLEEYAMLTTMLARKLKIAVVDHKMTYDKWKQAELDAQEQAKLDAEEAQLDLQRFKDMTQAA